MSHPEFSLESVRKIILEAIKNNKRFLFNELELQMLVAHTLEQEFKDGYIVHLEYRLPKGWSKDFDTEYARWGETPYFDIVLEHIIPEDSSQFIGIELKYKLKEVKLKEKKGEFKRFGMDGVPGIKLVSNQAAENEGRYDFWKDVKRLELLTKHFKNYVIGGIAIFLTNQKNYTNTDEDSYKYSAFGFSTKEVEKRLNWNHMVISDAEPPKWCPNKPKSKCQSCENPCGEDKKKSMDAMKCTDFCHFKRPNFSFERKHDIFWYDKKEGWEGPLQQKFYCCYVTVPEWKE